MAAVNERWVVRSPEKLQEGIKELVRPVPNFSNSNKDIGISELTLFALLYWLSNLRFAEEVSFI